MITTDHKIYLPQNHKREKSDHIWNWIIDHILSVRQKFLSFDTILKDSRKKRLGEGGSSYTKQISRTCVEGILCSHMKRVLITLEVHVSY